MEKREKRLINKSFEKTLLDSPVPNQKIKFFLSRNPSGNKSKIIKLLPKPLKLTKYVPPVSPPVSPQPKKPTPKPRILSKRPPVPPVPLPRSSPFPKPIAEKVKKLIDEITLYYKPEAISAFDKILKWYYDQKISSFFPSDFESVFTYRLTGKILSFEFYPKAVYFECKFWILRSAITHV